MSSLKARAEAPRLHLPKRVLLTPKQANIYAWGWQPDARFRYAVCGRRFGKTYLGTEEIRRAYRLAVERNIHPDNEIWYGAPTFKQAKRVFWNRLKRAIPESWLGARVNNTECVMTMRCGRIIRIVGLDDIDALRGSGLWFFIGDEWDDAKPAVWTEAIRPMLATDNGHALFIGTPKGFGNLYEGWKAGQAGHFTESDPEYDAMLMGRDPFTMSWKYNSIEGGNVPQAEVDQARRTLDPRTFRQEWESSFETFSGRVYYAFERQQNVKPYEFNPNLDVFVGMDFNVDPMTAVLFQEYKEDGKIISHQFGEIIIPTSSTHEMCLEIERQMQPLIGLDRCKTQVTVYPDPAGAGRRTASHGETDISILRKHFKVWAMSTHPLVRDRVNFVNSRFLSADGRRHMFIDPRCRHSIEALEKHTYKEGTSDPEKGEWDHVNDATGYYVWTRFAHQKAHGAAMAPHMAR